MKKLFAAVMLFGLFAAVACDSLDEEFTFYITEQDKFILEPDFPAGTEALLDTTTIVTNPETAFSKYRTSAELIKEITLDKFTLSITDTSGTEIDSTGADFDFLESVDVYISADNLDEVRVAYLDDVPATDSLNFYLNLNLTNTRVDEYLKKDRYTIRTHAKLRNAVVKDVVIVTDFRFKSIADPI